MTLAPPAPRPADNPFASHRVEGLAFRSPGPSPDALAQRILALGGRAAIVGPKGSGKTTLLGELAERLPADPVSVRLPGACNSPWTIARAQLPRAVGRCHAVLVDGGEQLGPVAWRRLLVATRRARCLVATLHRPGRLPTLIECRTDVALLRDLVSELMPNRPEMVDLESLFRRRRGDIRLCLLELYDLYAGRRTESSMGPLPATSDRNPASHCATRTLAEIRTDRRMGTAGMTHHEKGS